MIKSELDSYKMAGAAVPPSGSAVCVEAHEAFMHRFFGGTTLPSGGGLNFKVSDGPIKDYIEAAPGQAAPAPASASGTFTLAIVGSDAMQVADDFAVPLGGESTPVENRRDKKSYDPLVSRIDVSDINIPDDANEAAVKAAVRAYIARQAQSAVQRLGIQINPAGSAIRDDMEHSIVSLRIRPLATMLEGGKAGATALRRQAQLGATWADINGVFRFEGNSFNARPRAPCGTMSIVAKMLQEKSSAELMQELDTKSLSAVVTQLDGPMDGFFKLFDPVRYMAAQSYCDFVGGDWREMIPFVLRAAAALDRGETWVDGGRLLCLAALKNNMSAARRLLKWGARPTAGNHPYALRRPADADDNPVLGREDDHMSFVDALLETGLSDISVYAEALNMGQQPTPGAVRRFFEQASEDAMLTMLVHSKLILTPLLEIAIENTRGLSMSARVREAVAAARGRQPSEPVFPVLLRDAEFEVMADVTTLESVLTGSNGGIIRWGERYYETDGGVKESLSHIALSRPSLFLELLRYGLNPSRWSPLIGMSPAHFIVLNYGRLDKQYRQKMLRYVASITDLMALRAAVETLPDDDPQREEMAGVLRPFYDVFLYNGRRWFDYPRAPYVEDGAGVGVRDVITSLQRWGIVYGVGQRREQDFPYEAQKEAFRDRVQRSMEVKAHLVSLSALMKFSESANMLAVYVAARMNTQSNTQREELQDALNTGMRWPPRVTPSSSSSSSSSAASSSTFENVRLDQRVGEFFRDKNPRAEYWVFQQPGEAGGDDEGSGRPRQRRRTGEKTAEAVRRILTTDIEPVGMRIRLTDYFWQYPAFFQPGAQTFVLELPDRGALFSLSIARGLYDRWVAAEEGRKQGWVPPPVNAERDDDQLPEARFGRVEGESNELWIDARRDVSVQNRAADTDKSFSFLAFRDGLRVYKTRVLLGLLEFSRLGSQGVQGYFWPSGQMMSERVLYALADEFNLEKWYGEFTPKASSATGFPATAPSLLFFDFAKEDFGRPPPDSLTQELMASSIAENELNFWSARQEEGAEMYPVIQLYRARRRRRNHIELRNPEMREMISRAVEQIDAIVEDALADEAKQVEAKAVLKALKKFNGGAAMQATAKHFLDTILPEAKIRGVTSVEGERLEDIFPGAAAAVALLTYKGRYDIHGKLKALFFAVDIDNFILGMDVSWEEGPDHHAYPPAFVIGLAFGAALVTVNAVVFEGSLTDIKLGSWTDKPLVRFSERAWLDNEFLFEDATKARGLRKAMAYYMAFVVPAAYNAAVYLTPMYKTGGDTSASMLAAWAFMTDNNTIYKNTTLWQRMAAEGWPYVGAERRRAPLFDFVQVHQVRTELVTDKKQVLVPVLNKKTFSLFDPEHEPDDARVILEMRSAQKWDEWRPKLVPPGKMHFASWANAVMMAFTRMGAAISRVHLGAQDTIYEDFAPVPLDKVEKYVKKFILDWFTLRLDKNLMQLVDFRTPQSAEPRSADDAVLAEYRGRVLVNQNPTAFLTYQAFYAPLIEDNDGGVRNWQKLFDGPVRAQPNFALNVTPERLVTPSTAGVWRKLVEMCALPWLRRVFETSEQRVKDEKAVGICRTIVGGLYNFEPLNIFFRISSGYSAFLSRHKKSLSPVPKKYAQRTRETMERYWKRDGELRADATRAELETVIRTPEMTLPPEWTTYLTIDFAQFYTESANAYVRTMTSMRSAADLIAATSSTLRFTAPSWHEWSIILQYVTLKNPGVSSSLRSLMDTMKRGHYSLEVPAGFAPGTAPSRALGEGPQPQTLLSCAAFLQYHMNAGSDALYFQHRQLARIGHGRGEVYFYIRGLKKPAFPGIVTKKLASLRAMKEGPIGDAMHWRVSSPAGTEGVSAASSDPRALVSVLDKYPSMYQYLRNRPLISLLIDDWPYEEYEIFRNLRCLSHMTTWRQSGMRELLQQVEGHSYPPTIEFSPGARPPLVRLFYGHGGRGKVIDMKGAVDAGWVWWASFRPGDVLNIDNVEVSRELEDPTYMQEYYYVLVLNLQEFLILTRGPGSGAALRERLLDTFNFDLFARRYGLFTPSRPDNSPDAAATKAQKVMEDWMLGEDVAEQDFLVELRRLTLRKRMYYKEDATDAWWGTPLHKKLGDVRQYTEEKDDMETILGTPQSDDETSASEEEEQEESESYEMSHDDDDDDDGDDNNNDDAHDSSEMSEAAF